MRSFCLFYDAKPVRMKPKTKNFQHQGDSAFQVFWWECIMTFTLILCAMGSNGWFLDGLQIGHGFGFGMVWTFLFFEESSWHLYLNGFPKSAENQHQTQRSQHSKADRQDRQSSSSSSHPGAMTCCIVKPGHLTHIPVAVGLALFACAGSGGQFTGNEP